MVRDGRQYRRRIWAAAGVLVGGICIAGLVFTIKLRAGEEELYLAAETYWQQGKYSEAARYYERLIAQYPGGKSREKALWDAAITQYLYLRNIHRAIELYRMLIVETGNRDLRVSARRALGEIYLRDVGDLGQALEEFKSLCEEVRSEKERQEYGLALAEVYFRRNELREALVEYQRAAAAEADPHLAAKANLRIGSIKQLEHDYRSAVLAYEGVLAGTKCPECLYQARMGLLESFENLERFEDALGILASLEGDETIETFKAREKRRIEEKRSVLRGASAVNWVDKENQRLKAKN